jgi:KUP system potassium uptake protein
MEKHKNARTVLLLIVLCGASMMIGDGILTPAISVLSSMSGLKVRATGLHDRKYNIPLTHNSLVQQF